MTIRVVSRCGFVMAVVAAAALSGCEHESTKPTPPADSDISLVALAASLQRETFADLAALAYEIGVEQACKQYVAIVAARDDVEWAAGSRQGLAIQYVGGLRGGIFLDPDDGYPIVVPRAGESATLGREITPNGALGRNVLVLSPVSAARAEQVAPFFDAVPGSLVATGYGPVTLAPDGDADVDAFFSLGAHGIVHVVSHGWAWPSPFDIDEVYVMTGQTVPVDADSLAEGLVGASMDGFLIGYVPGRGNVYFLGPDVVAERVGPGAERTLVYLDVTYGLAGSWAATLRGAGIGAVVGPDWRVPIDVRSAWARTFYLDQLAPRLDAPPLTLSEWVAANDLTYLDDGGPSPVTARLAVDAREGIGLADEARLVMIEPGTVLAGTEVTLHGFGFGDEPGAVHLNDALAEVTTWSDDAVTIIAPGDLGEFRVRVETDRGPSAEGPTLWVAEPIRDRLQNVAVIRWTFSGLNTHEYGETQYTYYSSFSGSTELWGDAVPITWDGDRFEAALDTSWISYSGDYPYDLYCSGHRRVEFEGQVSADGLVLGSLAASQSSNAYCNYPESSSSRRRALEAAGIYELARVSWTPKMLASLAEVSHGKETESLL